MLPLPPLVALLRTQHRSPLASVCAQPEFIHITVTDPKVIEENGKKAYTLYTITTEVRRSPISRARLALACRLRSRRLL